MSNFKPEIIEPGTVTWPFRLGDVVRDRINGLEGVAIARLYHITGCDRFLIESAAQDGKKGEAFGASAERLELVKAQPEFHRDEVPPARVGLGDVVRDYSTGLEGRVTVIEVPLFGACRCNVEAGWDKKKMAIAEGWLVDEPFLEVLKPFKTPAEKQADTQKPAKTSRGASRVGREFMPKTRGLSGY